MRRISLILIIFCFVFGAETHDACGEWVSLSKGLDDSDIRSLAADPRNPNIIFTGSGKVVYKSADGGNSWKQIFSTRTKSGEVRFIYVDPLDSKIVYVCTSEGITKAVDGGKRWQRIYSGLSPRSKSVHCMSINRDDPNTLWIGTDDGLFVLNTKTNDLKKEQNIPAVRIYSVLSDEANHAMLVAADDGIYKKSAENFNWQRVLPVPAPSLEIQKEGSVSLNQFDIEEFALNKTNFSNLIFFPGQKKYFAVMQNRIVEAAPEGSSWVFLKNQNISVQKINFIERTSKTFYAATPQGVFQWDLEKSTFKEIYDGLGSKDVRTLSYSASGDYLLAGTAKGVFKLAFPELNILLPENKEGPLLKMADILGHFKYEPTILEIQNAAIHYAEVHPSKIEGWRRQAALKAWLPKVSLDQGVGRDQNIDLDRGGTADPDTFIQGPDEKNYDWSVNASWDLGEIIWNNDQTSIDTRSRLMVELRDDILNEVTHLYYERRRLQVEMMLAPMRDLAIQIEKEIRLQELTANIDALTGSYLSKRLKALRS